MSFTIPQLVYPLILYSGDGPHLTVTHTDHTDYDVTLGSSSGTTYYADGQAGDFLAALQAALNAAITDGGTWAVSWVGSGLFGRVSLTKTGGSKTVQEINFNHASLTGQMLGLKSGEGTGPVTLTGQAVTGLYRARWLWSPDDIATRSDPRPRRAATGPQGPTGSGLWVDWGGHNVITLYVPTLWGAFGKAKYAANALHAANADGLTTGDPNCAWDAWWSHFRDDHANTRFKTVRFSEDRDDPATYQGVRLNDQERLLVDPTSVLTEVFDAPLIYALSCPMSEVP